MNPNTTTVSAATASGAVALAAVVVLQWLLGLRHITLPADVATAIAVLLTAGVHCLVSMRLIPGAPAQPVSPPIVIPPTKES
jgi:predicted ATP-dependent Lon-type protease